MKYGKTLYTDTETGALQVSVIDTNLGEITRPANRVEVMVYKAKHFVGELLTALGHSMDTL